MTFDLQFFGATDCLQYFRGLAYGEAAEVVPGLTLTLHDAGHILGSAIVELSHGRSNSSRTLVFSGDLGYRDAPVINPPAVLRHADAVLLESTYGDRRHRAIEDTMDELTGVFEAARAGQGRAISSFRLSPWVARRTSCT